MKREIWRETYEREREMKKAAGAQITQSWHGGGVVTNNDKKGIHVLQLEWTSSS